MKFWTLCLLWPLAAQATGSAPEATGSAAGATGAAAEACLKADQAPAELLKLCSSALDTTGLSAGRRAAVLVQRGLARMRAGELDPAGADFDAALALDGQSSWGWNARAVFHLQKGELEAAIADDEQAVRLSPGYAFAWANLGHARMVHGDLDQALSDLGEAVRLAPQASVAVLTSRGRAFLAKGECALARSDFDAALKASPRHANAWSGRAWSQVCAGDFAAAAADFRRERQFRPDDESGVDLVIALRRAGQDASAELAALAPAGDPAKGQAPGIALFSGTLSPEQTLQAASDRDPRAARLRLCAASFEVGEWYLVAADLPHARQYLAQARSTCDPSQRQFGGAGAELARLK